MPMQRTCSKCGELVISNSTCVPFVCSFVCNGGKPGAASPRAGNEVKVEPFDPVDSERRMAVALLQAQQALAVSEKESERLKGERDFFKTKMTNAAICQADLDKYDEVTAERDTLRRELENLKREHSMRVADGRATIAQFGEDNSRLQNEVTFLQRELDRERQKNRKRGL
jgi:hypothetical protein